jgi:hypothetical protein
MPNVGRWWPAAGLVGLIVVGLIVGKGSTPLDDWFRHTGDAHPGLGMLLFFTDGRVSAAVAVSTLCASAFQRRWRLALVTLVAPPVAVLAARVAKRIFGRLSDGVLAYPSGHTTLAVTVLGLAVLAVGVTAWSLTVAAVVTTLGMLGQAFTYHYFTDTVGALFLATAVVCLAAWAAGLDRCQPGCDLRHSGG